MAQRTPYACRECGETFVVAHEPGEEPTDLAPVGCPGCGAVQFVVVPVGVRQALGCRILSEQTATQACNGCARLFDLVFHAEPQEPRARVPVACPYCGWVNYGSVATSALEDLTEAPRFEARRRTGRLGSPSKKGRTA